MASYLRLEVGPYYLLLPTDEVFEVLSFAPAPGEPGFVAWREDILSTVSLRGRLGLPEAGTGFLIIHGEDGVGREGLVVDKVLGLVELAEGDFQPVPLAASGARIHFDRVWTDSNAGRQALRLRSSRATGGAHASVPA
ncbi:MAG: chemotaxis protein CheW [Pseudomonadota bacterium]